MARQLRFIPCRIAMLPVDQHLAAARTAVSINPVNAPSVEPLAMLAGPAGGQPSAGRIAVQTSKFWESQARQFGVSFMEATGQPLRDRILAHMNAWSDYCNKSFAWSQSQGEIRISRGQGGYYSYLGTDCLHVPANEQTMNLEGFTLNTPESECRRVIRHEAGHALGAVHEHLRQEIVNRLDPLKTINYFMQTQNWTAQMVRDQVLTPVSESLLKATLHAEEDSIMCYMIDRSCTKDGRAVKGGVDITADDGAEMGKCYPKSSAPPPPPVGPPPLAGVILADLAARRVTIPAGWTAVNSA